MQALADTMSHQLTDDGISFGLDKFLNSISNVPYPVAIDGFFNAKIKRLFGCFEKG